MRTGQSVRLAHPTILTWGGPTGVATRGDLATGDVVAFYGYGLGFGATHPTRARAGLLLTTTADEYRSDMPAVNGDSGAPVIHVETGKALGIVSHYGLPLSTDEGPLMTFVMAELAKAGFALTLATGG